MRWQWLLAACLGSLLLGGCGSSSSSTPKTIPPPSTPPPAITTIGLSAVVSGLTQPVGMTSLADGRIFVLEQPGRIRILRAGSVVSAPFLDITGKVESGGETGLLGLAFHPQFAQNQRLFVNYTRLVSGQLQSVTSEFTVSSSNPDSVDPSTERILLKVNKRFGNHNGGQIAFGPDGFLYIGLGDGGGQGDPEENGQDINVLLGKVLRIDVDSAAPYGIPADNPFASGGGRPEIFAFGFRNPWRFSFDQPTGRLFVADVGEENREEVDVVTRGGNYGWNRMEGTACFEPSTGCDQAGLTLPIHDYGRSDGGTIIGGFVYRGSDIPSLAGAYVFGDFLSGRVWALRESDGSWARSDLLSTGLTISSFGQDSAGELYLLDYNGRVLKVVPM